jgi:uncharacterized sulfatase
MFPRILALVFCWLCAAALQPGAAEAEPIRPNIIWIIADDLSPELGCYGYPHVRTPNIDRIAREGARFTRAFSSAPVCSSSRSAFITGMYQTSIACQHHRTEDPKPLPPSVKTLPDLLRAAGYFVTNCQDPGGKKWGKSDYNFVYDQRKIFDGPDWHKRKPGQPFFAQVQIKEPHRPFVNEPVTEQRHLDAPLPPVYADHPLAHRDWAAYLQSIEALDAKVGQVLDDLERDGVAQNTVVMFFGDHGRPHVRDKQWLYDGGLLVPLLVRWPGKIEAGSVRDELVSLIDLAPTCLRMAGAEVPEAMQGVGFFPAQSPTREFIAGARDRCGDADDRIRCIRTSRFKYIRNFRPELPYTQQSSYKEVQYPMLPLMRQLHSENKLTPAQAAFFAPSKPAEELYDVVSDPWEMKNLAGDPQHAATLRQLGAKLDQWMRETHDMGGAPETNPTLAEIIATTRSTTYEKPLKQRGLPAHPTDRQMIDWWQSYYRK